MRQATAHDLNHMTDGHLGICISAFTKEISHAPIALEDGPYDARWPAQAQRRACHAGKERVNSVFSRFELRREKQA
jgi:hypothetical protein